MKIIHLFFSLSLLVILSSCHKSGSQGDDPGPSGLTLKATVTSNNSGEVSFVAAATNATSYEFNFGNGIYQSSTTGSLTYKYSTSGNYTVVVTAKASNGKTATATAQVAITLSSANLVFSDEFDTPGAPDPAKWGYDLGAGGWGNNELQYYTNRSDNIVVSNGTLKIFSKKEMYNGASYTSARIQTNNKFAFKYGRVEVRAKLPSGGGTWPAIWMLGSNFTTNPWPACGEIDIMEHVGNQLNKIFSTLHHPGHSGGNGDQGTTMLTDATSAFHKYGLEWTASTLKFSVDDVVYYTFNNNASLPFNNNFFIILNSALGGNFGGTIDPAFTASTFEIDYVRVYN